MLLEHSRQHGLQTCRAGIAQDKQRENPEKEAPSTPGSLWEAAARPSGTQALPRRITGAGQPTPPRPSHRTQRRPPANGQKNGTGAEARARKAVAVTTLPSEGGGGGGGTR